MSCVWVERLEVTGFKRLVGTFEFDQELTVVVGPNEAGKSSLGEAFVRSVWGFQWRERRKREDGSKWERCRPWGGEPWRIVASLVDHEGARLRAEWDFAEHKVRLLDRVTGDDLSDRVAARRGDVTLGGYLTGVSFSDFEDVCLFDQHTLSGVERSDTLVNALQRAVDSVESDVGVADADTLLKDFLNTHVGARSDTYRLLSGGPLQRDVDERSTLETRLDAMQHEESTLQGLAQDLRRSDLQCTVLTEEQLEIERGIRLAELAEAHAVQGEGLRLQELAELPSETPAPLDEQVVNDAREAFGAVDQAEHAIGKLERAVSTARPEIDEFRAEEKDLSGKLEVADQTAEVDRSGEPEVRDGLTALRQLDEVVPEQVAPVPDRDPELSRYRDLRGQLLEMAGSSEAPWDKTRIAAAIATALLSIALAALIHPLALAGLLVAGLIVATARSAESSALATRLRSEFGVGGLDELERRVQEEETKISRAVATANAAREAEAGRVAAREKIATRIAAALDAVSAPPGPTGERAARYLDSCLRHDHVQGIRKRLGEVRAHLTEITEPERDLATRRAERDSRRTDLEAALRRLGIDGHDLAAARVELNERVRSGRGAAERRAEALTARQALDARLSGRTLEDLEREVSRAESALRAHEEDHPGIAVREEDLPSLRSRLEETKQDLAAASQRAAGLRAQIAERESRLPSVSELRERLATLDDQIESRQLALDAIRTAREALSEAARQAHRNFAPHLQRALHESLPLFTSGRYREATIADDLSISVIAPETQSQVPAEWLSFGTRDQIYLVQRLEIAKMLIPTTGPVPLLLDEPFAEFDRDRERSALELLCREAEQRQVILFTKDPELVELVTAVRGVPHVIELDLAASSTHA
jgi:uncharacterized protein YhaN